MDNESLLALYDRLMRLEVEYPEMQRERLPGLVRHTRPAPGRSFVLYSQLDEAGADAAIEEQIAYYRQRGLTFEWKVYDHDSPPDLLQRLQQRGAEVDEPEAILALDLQHTPAELLLPPGADVRPIATRQGLADVIAVEQQVWGGEFDWIYERLGGHLEIPGYVNVYVAYAEGQPACTAWVYFNPNGVFADLWGGSTLPAYRQRGLYMALLRVRVQAARQRGYRYLTVDAGPMSRPILERHGFRLLDIAHACTFVHNI